MRQLLLLRDSDEQLQVLQAMPENDPMSYFEAYFKKYWILSGRSVKQKKLSLLAMLLEYKNVSAQEQRGAVWERR